MYTLYNMQGTIAGNRHGEDIYESLTTAIAKVEHCLRLTRGSDRGLKHHALHEPGSYVALVVKY